MAKDMAPKRSQLRGLGLKCRNGGVGGGKFTIMGIGRADQISPLFAFHSTLVRADPD